MRTARTASLVALCLSAQAASLKFHPGCLTRPHHGRIPRHDRVSLMAVDHVPTTYVEYMARRRRLEAADQCTDSPLLDAASTDEQQLSIPLSEPWLSNAAEAEAKRAWLDKLDIPTWGMTDVTITSPPAVTAIVAQIPVAPAPVSSAVPPASAIESARLDSGISQPVADPVAATQGRVVPSGMVGAGGEEKGDGKKLLQKIKDAGIAGIISYGLVQICFWGASIPICIFGYYKVTGHWPDLSNADDQKQLGAEAFAFLNVARLAIPLRIALALSMTTGVQENLVDRLQNLKKE
mmetsp:Transcript_7328/g.19242  ORF Transcript_7328/g.19242 Transcript_7328/m.19242 type:complete len:293 (+) Transcript_7328:6-884(+)